VAARETTGRVPPREVMMRKRSDDATIGSIRLSSMRVTHRRAACPRPPSFFSNPGAESQQDSDKYISDAEDIEVNSDGAVSLL
jgi:hypothetical protein